MKYINTMNNLTDSKFNFRKNFQKYFVFILLLIFFIIGYCFADETKTDENIISGKMNEYYINTLPIVIDTPGIYYLNSSDTIDESAIKIIHSDIVLDGFGKTLNGNMSAGSLGIFVNTPQCQDNNIIIKNLTITGFETGIRLDNSNQIFLEDVHLISNLRSGLSIESSGNIEISECSSKNTNNDISGGYGIQIMDSNEIKIRNAQVTGNGKSGKPNSGGVMITNSPRVSIINSQVTSNPGFGLRVERDTDNFILSESEISANYADGIIINSCMFPTIQDSVLSKNKESGVELEKVKQPTITGNTISQNTLGLSITNTEEMVLSGNTLNNNRIGFDISASDIRYYNHQISYTNTINSRPLLYLNGAQDRKIGPGTNPSMVIIVNSSDISVSDLVLSKNCAGIILANCENITLSSISFMENGIGLRSEFGTKNLVCKNLHAERNLLSGYYLSNNNNFTLSSLYGQESPSGVIIHNSVDGLCNNIFMSRIFGIKSRLPSGITLSGCKNVTVTNSELSQCSYAGLLSDSKDIVLSNNFFIFNEFAGSVILSGPVNIHQNSFLKNEDTGLVIRTNQSSVIQNIFEENKKLGLLILQGNENLFVENIFNNLENCLIQEPVSYNIWNGTRGTSSEPSMGGNYWGDLEGEGFSDLCSTDIDEYCSIPYIIRQNNIDFHPLSKKEIIKTLTMVTDLNQNGYEDLHDVVVYMNKLTSGDTSSLYDYSGDGRINLNDVVALFNIITKNTNKAFA